MQPVASVSAYSATQLADLKRAVHEHLQKTAVAAQLRGALDDFVAKEGPAATATGALLSLAHHGVVEHVLRTLGDPASILAARTSLAAPPTAAAPSPPPGRGPYLMIRVPTGRAFTACVSDEALAAGGGPVGTSGAGTLTLAAEVDGVRSTAGVVPGAVAPRFNATFLFDLNRRDDGRGHVPPVTPPPVTRMALLRQSRGASSLSLAVARDSPEGGGRALVGCAVVDWRRVLTAAAGRVTLSVDLRIPGDAAGAACGGLLDITLELIGLPDDGEAPLGVAVLTEQHRCEASSTATAMGGLLTRAQAWWGGYVAARSGLPHPGRPVRLFAPDASGRQRPLPSFLRPPLRTRLLGDAATVARFVSLIPGAPPPPTGPLAPEGDPPVRGTLAVFHSGGATPLERAVVLTRLLSGLGHRAALCLGRDGSGAAASWVMTRGPRGAPTLWAPTTGVRYGAGPGASPLCDAPWSILGCVVDATSVWAHVAACDGLVAARYDLSDGATWHRLDVFGGGATEGEDKGGVGEGEGDGGWDALSAPTGPVCATPPGGESCDASESRLEAYTQDALAHFRARAGLHATPWGDDAAAHLLTPLLIAAELQATRGQAAAGDARADAESALARATPRGSSLRGVPVHVGCSRSGPAVAAAVLRDAAARALLSASDPAVVFTLRVLVTPYPEGIASVWVMLAVVGPAT